MRCDFCSKDCDTRSQLIKHRRIHTGEKPFSCGVCGKSFSQKSNLSKHSLIHGGQQFVCQFCRKAFSAKQNLIRHQNAHDEKFVVFPCEYCDAEMSSKREMLQHVQKSHQQAEVKINSSGYKSHEGLCDIFCSHNEIDPSLLAACATCQGPLCSCPEEPGQSREEDSAFD